MESRSQWTVYPALFLHSPPEQPSIGQASLHSSHFRKLAASLMAKATEKRKRLLRRLDIIFEVDLFISNMQTILLIRKANLSAEPLLYISVTNQE